MQRIHATAVCLPSLISNPADADPAHPHVRHCEERSDEAIHQDPARSPWIASPSARNDGEEAWVTITGILVLNGCSRPLSADGKNRRDAKAHLRYENIRHVPTRTCPGLSRSEERRAGKECVRTVRSRGTRAH